MRTGIEYSIKIEQRDSKMAYADSAIDYVWEIVNLDVKQRSMTVKYDPADSSDAVRSSVFLNLTVASDQFNISDLTSIANSTAAESNVVMEWDKMIEASSANPSFDPNTLIGNVYSSRFKVRTEDAKPYYNYYTQSCDPYDSEGADEIRTKYTLTDLNDSEKATARLGARCNRRALWAKLAADGNLDDITNNFGVNDSYDTYNKIDISFMTTEMVEFGDSLAVSVQGVLALNDSDWASWLHSASSTYSGTIRRS
jgi:hypothetical protein